LLGADGFERRGERASREDEAIEVREGADDGGRAEEGGLDADGGEGEGGKEVAAVHAVCRKGVAGAR